MADDSNSMQKKILFLGDRGVGKTTLIKGYLEYVRQRYGVETLEGKFLALTQYVYDHPVEEKKVLVRLLDLPDDSTRESRRDQYPAEVDMIVFCFAIDNPPSIHHIESEWLNEVPVAYGLSRKMYLLGLKSDLRDNEERRELVTAEDASDLHRMNQFKGEYMECSHIANPNHANDVMTELVNKAVSAD